MLTRALESYQQLLATILDLIDFREVATFELISATHLAHTSHARMPHPRGD